MILYGQDKANQRTHLPRSSFNGMWTISDIILRRLNFTHLKARARTHTHTLMLHFHCNYKLMGILLKNHGRDSLRGARSKATAPPHREESDEVVWASNSDAPGRLSSGVFRARPTCRRPLQGPVTSW